MPNMCTDLNSYGFKFSPFGKVGGRRMYLEIHYFKRVKSFRKVFSGRDQIYKNKWHKICMGPTLTLVSYLFNAKPLREIIFIF